MVWGGWMVVTEALTRSALDAHNMQLFVSQKTLKGKPYCFVLAFSLEMRRLSAELQNTIFKIVFGIVNQAACNILTFVNTLCSTAILVATPRNFIFICATAQ
jgi:hypothetical protein